MEVLFQGCRFKMAEVARLACISAGGLGLSAVEFILACLSFCTISYVISSWVHSGALNLPHWANLIISLLASFIEILLSTGGRTPLLIISRCCLLQSLGLHLMWFFFPLNWNKEGFNVAVIRRWNRYSLEDVIRFYTCLIWLAQCPVFEKRAKFFLHNLEL